MRETLHEVVASLIILFLTWAWNRLKNYRRESKRVQEENRHRIDVLWQESGFQNWDGVDRRQNDRRVHALNYTGPERRQHERRRRS